MTCEGIHGRRLTRKKAAEYLGYHPGTLDKWASKGINLKYHMVGGRVYYDIADLEEFLRGQQTF
jgi:excisionase family DNA binding protein